MTADPNPREPRPPELPPVADIDSETPHAELTTEQADALTKFRQGDWLPDVSTLFIGDAANRPRTYQTPAGVVIISQTCDLVLPNRATVQAAPVVSLEGAKASEARNGKRPRYIHVPTQGLTQFADLQVVGTLDKRYVAQQRRIPGVATDQETSEFGRAAGRRFGRFAFPDEITPWLQPLADEVMSRHDKASPEGEALRHVTELRLQSTGLWASGPPFELKLFIIVKPGTLPFATDDDPPDMPESLDVWLHTSELQLKRSSAEIAGKLATTSAPTEKYWLWMALGESWAAKCRPAKGRHSKTDTVASVSSIVGEVVSADDFTLVDVRASEMLDLDHLSLPEPG